MASGAMEFRAVQLDLARQMETLEYIYGFTDMITRHGFNTLVLYLEARIRTASFPWLPEDESYSPDDIRKIVAHAAAQGIEGVPVVSNLGHGELFLRRPELAHLWELREGVPNRLGADDPGMSFCLSLEESYTFFEAYFSEVAALFPSPWFHVGCDEFFDFACCSLCRQHSKGEAAQTALFVRHINRTHGILKQLGKRIMMWDDMFEHYPSALDSIPTDIVMCPGSMMTPSISHKGILRTANGPTSLHSMRRVASPISWCPGCSTPTTP